MRESIELNITSLLDMMSTILFFLLLSVSFMTMTSLSLPPSAKSSVTNPFAEVPLSPKVFAFTFGKNSLRVVVKWEGDKPGQVWEDVIRVESDDVNENLLIVVTKLVEKFIVKFPQEKSIQMSLSADINYQEMISIMDGLRTRIANIVLLSYKESHAVAKEQLEKGS